MLKKRIIVTVICSLIIGCLAWFVFPNRLTASAVKDTQPASYQVYKSDGSIATLTPSPQHPLIFFAIWCPDCKKELANKTNPNAYYIDTFAKESSTQESFKAVQEFIKTNHTDPDSSRYFVSVDKHPLGVPSVPYTVTK